MGPVLEPMFSWLPNCLAGPPAKLEPGAGEANFAFILEVHFGTRFGAHVFMVALMFWSPFRARARARALALSLLL